MSLLTKAVLILLLLVNWTSDRAFATVLDIRAHFDYLSNAPHGILTIETWVDSLAWERAMSPAAPDRRIGRTDGPDCASPGYFAKKNPKV